jgi:hypothetical protein
MILNWAGNVNRKRFYKFLLGVLLSSTS